MRGFPFKSVQCDGRLYGKRAVLCIYSKSNAQESQSGIGYQIDAIGGEGNIFFAYGILLVICIEWGENKGDIG